MAMCQNLKLDLSKFSRCLMGKLPFLMGKSPFLMGKSTISMAIFNSFLYVHQRVTILVGGVEHFFLFSPTRLGMMIQSDFHIFRGG